MDLDPADPAIREAAVTLANNSVLPTWLAKAALGRDMTPIAEIAVAAAMPLIVRATADAIADEIEQERYRQDRFGASDPWQGGMRQSERIARAHGRTPETDTTEAE